MTRLIFIRHGQSEGNVGNIFTGRTDVRLTALGELQAVRTAELLRDVKIDRIYSSPLTRALQTAQPTADLHGLEIVKDPGLMEIMAGEWEGLPYDTIGEKFPESRQVWVENIGLSCPDGGESVREVYQRTVAETNRLVSQNKGKCIALFSHATPALSLGCYWQGLPPEKMMSAQRMTNASVSVADYGEDGSIHIRAYAYREHLLDLV